MSEVLPLLLTKTQLPDGRWMISYNGDALDYECGTYYLSVMIDGVKWYSEMFTLKDVNASVHPGLIKDTPHCAIRFYDNILKQNYYKCKDLCDLPINPIDHIIPFVIDVSRIPGLDINSIKTVIKCYDGQNEYDLSNEFNYRYDAENKVLIHDGHQFSGHLYCGIYYLELSSGVTSAILYEADFSKWETRTDPILPYQPIGLAFQNASNNATINRENNKLRVNTNGVQGSAGLSMFFKQPYSFLPPGSYNIKINIEEITSSIYIAVSSDFGNWTVSTTGIHEFNFIATTYCYITLNFRQPATFLISEISIGDNNATTAGVTLYSDHFKVFNFTHVPVENLYLYTESGTETGYEPIITDDNQEIILQI